MHVWVVRETVIRFGEPVHRHSMIPAKTKMAAISALRRHLTGEVSVVGRIINGRDRYFPA